MGVRGLATFVRDQASLRESKTFNKRSENDTSPATVIVVDGWSFLYALFLESRLPSIYGGEYGDLAALTVHVCRSWLSLGLAPTFVFDGPVPADKITVVQRRYQESFIDPSTLYFRTSPLGRSTSSFHTRISSLPPLTYTACVDALLGLKDSGVECFFADGEADPECAGLAAVYGGYVLAQDSDYLVFNAPHKGYIPLDDLVWAVPADPSSSSAPQDIGDDDGFQTVSRTKKRSAPEPDGIIRSLIPPPTFLSLTVTIQHPESLAAHLKLSTGLLPLVASLLGNDFTPPTFTYNFFPKNMPIPERIRRAASVVSSIVNPPSQSSRPSSLSHSAAHKRRGFRARLLKSVRSSDKVTQLIASVVADLVIRDDLVGEHELTEMIHIIRESIFHYIVPDAFPGPGPLADPDLECNFSHDHAQRGEEQRKVQRRFVRAYRRGEFGARLMGCYTTGTYWPRPAFEDPDVKTSQDVVGSGVREWIYAVLADGLEGVGREEAEAKEGDEEGDGEDELIDVVEEMSDSEEGEYDMVGESISSLATGTGTGMSMSGSLISMPEQDLSSFDPLDLLRTQLENLRGSQPVGVLPANGAGSVSTRQGTGMDYSILSLQSGIESVDSERKRPAGPRYVTEYLRRGTRLVPSKTLVSSLSDLISSASSPSSSDPTIERGDPLDPLPGVGTPTSTPIQLQSSSTRLSLFLYAVYSNTASIRALPEHWTLLAVALRWTVVASAMGHPAGGQKGTFEGRWTRSEVRAFIASCSFSSSSSSLSGLGGEGDGEKEHPFTTPAQLDPASLSTRTIQLSSMLLSSLENISEFAQSLLLNNHKEEKLRVSGVVRAVSFRRFHWLVGRMGAERDVYGVSFAELDGSEEGGEVGEKEEVWKAVLEGLEGCLGEESWAKPQRGKPKKDKAPAKVQVPTGAKKGAPAPRASKFDILATLGADY